MTRIAHRNVYATRRINKTGFSGPAKGRIFFSSLSLLKRLRTELTVVRYYRGKNKKKLVHIGNTSTYRAAEYCALLFICIKFYHKELKKFSLLLVTHSVSVVTRLKRICVYLDILMRNKIEACKHTHQMRFAKGIMFQLLRSHQIKLFSTNTLWCIALDFVVLCCTTPAHQIIIHVLQRRSRHQRRLLYRFNECGQNEQTKWPNHSQILWKSNCIKYLHRNIDVRLNIIPNVCQMSVDFFFISLMFQDTNMHIHTSPAI